MNMQLIRAINKSNKSNNNNNQKSSESKVVIVAPPARSSAGQHQQQKYDSSNQSGAPVSPSVTLPALKKRTSIVKQSVPPPVPPRGSPRSKSNLIGVSRCRNQKRSAPRQPTKDVDRLQCLLSFEESGCQKVEKWLETVEIPKFVADDRAAISIPGQIEFKSVKKLIQTFAERDDDFAKNSFVRGQKVFDSSLVKFRVESYNSLHHGTGRMGKRMLMSSDGGTDSGIDIPARSTTRRDDRMRFQPIHWIGREEAYV